MNILSSSQPHPRRIAGRISDLEPRDCSDLEHQLAPNHNQTAKVQKYKSFNFGQGREPLLSDQLSKSKSNHVGPTIYRGARPRQGAPREAPQQPFLPSIPFSLSIEDDDAPR